MKLIFDIPDWLARAEEKDRILVLQGINPLLERVPKMLPFSKEEKEIVMMSLVVHVLMLNAIQNLKKETLP